MKKILTLSLVMLTLSTSAWAQCAMCKTTIVNNVSQGELALAEGLNFGIMYLFATPYLAVVAIGGVWYYKYKKHGKKQRSSTT
ncbi:hypothetical protein BFP72_14310 [Reichenbachiella sp. 5M10]|uniref:hypothetical protein n=1 Tax=Reichenbachiella sp. 5M10 TaxID=1889772 RepID=UPI000C148733|nr:hypothetical protein [Reichenbachiella sp. 5M10]PIB36487.1 hypothetical protein BFP72_14310 [Reichenbachiella sp. 5M10]